MCLSEKIVVAEYPDKIECNELNPNKTVNEVSKIKSVLKPFDRKELINDFLINEIKVDAFEKSSEIVIQIDNPNEFEIRNFDLVIDSKKLSDKIIYDIQINGKSRFVQKDSLTNYYKINFESISPKEEIRINIIFDNNI
ncbi:Hypothetical protein IALB_2025 [Ignavibacterium album JCM 16511]|uniref:Uncharacterized protein n=1 Tax=Ignavibacterium album (strain DSM 19864 / JCM 16511 / NBRC 101810 / Mat9-16) TaxID=945713 RepID=I0AL73_IGNAJ|nr:hypothetical protein [Ignavibacterium album]AFH49730.1 Hypothetical protein IALB_2025 [Ignavibacterium album JCM 16511]